MTDSDEQFEIFTKTGEPLGMASRSNVHREGLWHKSVQVFLFDGTGRLILQRRVATKDVCGGLWDLSVAEHLRPGESYLDGATRGMEEELGITDVPLEPIGSPYAGRLDQDALGIHDYELQQAFSGHHAGGLHPDPLEVADVRAVVLEDLRQWLRARPSEFTPWFQRDVIRCGIIPAP